MKLLITGGCGFLGSNLASHAINLGIDLCIFDNLYRTGSQNNLTWLRKQGKFEFIHGDIRNSNDVQRLVSRFKPDVVFHLAGQVAMTTSITDPRMDFEVNALGTVNLLESIRTISPQAKIIYSSTNKVYGDLEQYTYMETKSRYVNLEFPNGFNEETPLDFHSPYGCSKGAADQYLRDYHRIFDINTVVFRHSSMYGGRQFSTVDQGWIGWFCHIATMIESSQLNKSFSISGNGKQVRDVLHAEDMVSLYFETLVHAEKLAGEVFNIGGGITNSLSLLELFEILEQEINQPLSWSKLPPRQSDQRLFVADISKINKLTGWVPRITAREGISNMMKWSRMMDKEF
jgi:CDP-paratose 2-epimerase